MQADDRTSARLSAYVPAYIRQRIVEDGDTFDRPRCVPLETAVLFADISGFTPLTARYEREGRLGLEKLTEILNAYFARTIAAVMACGGDIESISGDGLVAFWDVRDGRDLASCVRYARECGQRLHDGAGEILSGGAPLRLRAAVVCGHALAVEVGGTEDRRHFLLSGAPLFEITETLDRAQPGGTALSAAAAALLEPGAPNGQIGPPPARPSLESRHLPDLTRFLPRQVIRLAEPGGGQLFAEFRRITVCFLRLTGLVCDSPRDLERVQQAIGRADTIVHRYGGGEQSLTMNDKGALLMVVFGLPGTAHEDDPVRAVLAMRELLTSLDDLWLDCTCGVATGVAYCGPIGGEERRIYTVIGSVVNMAASLSDIRGSRIVCDAETARTAGSRIAFESLPGAVGKGLSTETRLFRPSTRRARLDDTRDLVGRGRELEELVGLLDGRLAEQRGAMALVEGEAGIGKSTLMRALSKQAAARGFQILAGASDAFDRSTPFRAWREPFAALLGLEPGADSAAIQRAVGNWTSAFPDLAPLAPLLGSVLAVSLPDTDLTRHMHGAVRAENTLLVLMRTLEARARKPTLLLLDDVQWLDPSSLDLLSRIDVEALGLVVCLGARSGSGNGDGSDFETLLSRPDVRRMSIQGMSDEAIRALIARRLGATAVPAALVEFVRERAAGNPYYSEEVAAILLDSGRLSVHDGQCAISGVLDELSMNGSLESVIASRVDLLRPPEQYTVKIASVQGRRVAYDMLSGVRQLAPDEPPLPRQLAELTRREILLEIADEPSRQYLFKHLITQQAIYNRLLFAQRRELHMAVAHWMETHFAHEVASHLAVIGTHWSLAEHHDKAATYFERAGERSLRGGAHRETIHLLERALQSLGNLAGPREPHREARILRQLGDAHRRRGALVDSEQTLIDSLRRLGVSWPRTKASVSGRLLVEMLRQLWRRTLRRQPPASSDRETERSYVYAHLSSINFFLNRPAEMMLASTCAVNAGERSTDKLHLAEAYLLFANVMGIIGLHRAAHSYTRLADACTPPGLSAVQHVMSNELRSLYLGSVGALGEAQTRVEAMLSASREIGDERHLREALSLLGIITLMRGDAEQSRSHRDAFFEKAMQANDDQTQCWAWIERAEHDLHRGDLAAAVAGFTTATSLLGVGSSTERVWIAGQLAEAQLLGGDRAAARETATAGLASLAAAPPTGFYALEGCAGIADVFLELGDRKLATRAVKRLGAFARSFPIGRPRHLLAQGRLRALAGHRPAAEALTRKALDEARHLGLPRDVTLAEGQLKRLAGAA